MDRYRLIRVFCVASLLFACALSLAGCGSSGFLDGLWGRNSGREQAVKHDEYGNAVLDDMAKPDDKAKPKE